MKRQLRQKWASRWTENPKGRSRQKLETNFFILIGWNPKRAIYAKVKDHDKVTTSVRHDPLGASSYQKTSNSKHLQIKNSEQGQCASVKHDPFGASSYQKTSDSKHLQIKDSEQGKFKVVRENSGYMCSMYLPHITYHFSNFSKIHGATPLAGHHSIHQIWSYAHLFGTLIYSICIVSSIFYGNTWSENFQNTKLFYIFWKVWTKNTPSLNSWVVEAYIGIHLENGYTPEEKHG